MQRWRGLTHVSHVPLSGAARESESERERARERERHTQTDRQKRRHTKAAGCRREHAAADKATARRRMASRMTALGSSGWSRQAGRGREPEGQTTGQVDNAAAEDEAAYARGQRTSDTASVPRQQTKNRRSDDNETVQRCDSASSQMTAEERGADI